VNCDVSATHRTRVAVSNEKVRTIH